MLNEVSIVAREAARPAVSPKWHVSRTRMAAGRLAWVGDDGAEPALFAQRLGDEPARLLSLRGARVDELALSPDGRFVAYLLGNALPSGVERQVGWVRVEGRSEVGRVDGAAFAFGASGRGLVVADLRRQSLVHVELDSGKERVLSTIADDGDVALPPRLALSPSGKHLAFSCRQRARNLSELWLLPHGGGAAELVTQVPGARAWIGPFWSPKGRSLGMHVVHSSLGRSAIIVLRHLEGEGEILHSHDLLDAAFAPAWSPSGRSVVAWLAAPSGPARLAMLDVRTRAIHVLGDDLPLGRLSFLGPRQVVIESEPAVEILTLSADA